MTHSTEHLSPYKAKHLNENYGKLTQKSQRRLQSLIYLEASFVGQTYSFSVACWTLMSRPV